MTKLALDLNLLSSTSSPYLTVRKLPHLTLTSGKPYFTEALTVLTGARWAHARLEHTYLDNQCVILQENNFVACTKT